MGRHKRRCGPEKGPLVGDRYRHFCNLPTVLRWCFANGLFAGELRLAHPNACKGGWLPTGRNFSGEMPSTAEVRIPTTPFSDGLPAARKHDHADLIVA